MGSDEMEGSEMTFLVVLFGVGGGADGRLAILGIPVDETTSPLVNLGSTTIGAALTAGIGFAALTDFAALAAGCGVGFAGAAGAGLFLVAALGVGVAFLAGAFEAVFTATFLAGTRGFFTGALAAGAVFLAAGLAAGFLAMAFLAGAAFLGAAFLGAAFLGAALGAGLVAAGFFAGAAFLLMDFTADLLAATVFDLVGLLLLTMLAPRVLKYQPAFAFDTCNSHGPGVGRGTWVTES